MSPYYVGANRQLPKGKRGRCVIRDLLTHDERTVLSLKLSIMAQVEKFGYFVIETWECPNCFANIPKEDGWRLTILKHECSEQKSSGAYVSPRLTTSGKIFDISEFMMHEDILKLAKQYLEIVAKREEENGRLWKREK